jgi:hypothetical protein
MDEEETVLHVRINIVGLFVIGLCWFGISPSPAQAEEVGVHYQVLSNQQDADTTTTNLIVEIWNLSGHDLNHLTVNRSTLSPSIPDEGAVSIGTLTTTESRMIMTSFTVPNEYLLPDNMSFEFYLKYDTADGIPRSAIVPGQPTVFIGNPTP